MNKYRNQRTVVDGIVFDSHKEACRWCELRLLERAGEIQSLQRQVAFELIPKSRHGRAIRYVADFVYIESGQQVIEDVKGMRTDVYKLKKRMMAEQGKEIREV